MEIQYQYATEIHPDADEGKLHLCGNTGYLLKLKVDFMEIEFFVIKSNELKKLFSSG